MLLLVDKLRQKFRARHRAKNQSVVERHNAHQHRIGYLAGRKVSGASHRQITAAENDVVICAPLFKAFFDVFLRNGLPELVSVALHVVVANHSGGHGNLFAVFGFQLVHNRVLRIGFVHAIRHDFGFYDAVLIC